MHDLTQFHTVLDTLYRACFIDTSHFLLILHRANSFSKQRQARTLYIVSGRVTSTALHRLSIIPLGMMRGRLEAIPREVEISEFFFFFFYYGQNIFFYSFFYSLLFLRSSIFIYEYKNSPKVTVIKIQYERYNFFLFYFIFIDVKRILTIEIFQKKKMKISPFPDFKNIHEKSR